MSNDVPVVGSWVDYVVVLYCIGIWVFLVLVAATIDVTIDATIDATLDDDKTTMTSTKSN